MAAFNYDLRAMLRKFAIVTVWDVDAYEAKRDTNGNWDAAATLKDENKLFSLDSLKISNINAEGPTKEIKGGQNADTLLKYGKTYSIEMQDALGRYNVLQAIYGVNFSKNAQFATITDAFPGEITLVGTTYAIDQATGAKQPMNIVVPIFLGDGLFNLSQDAEGDASVFDMNGNILRFYKGSDTGANEKDPIVAEDYKDGVYKSITEDQGKITYTAIDAAGTLYGKGADNEYYFFCTKEGYTELTKKGYEQAIKAETPTDKNTDTDQGDGDDEIGG